MFRFKRRNRVRQTSTLRRPQQRTIEPLEGRELLSGITQESLVAMAVQVAEIRRLLQVAPFDSPVTPTFRVQNATLGDRAGRVVVQFQGAGGGGIDPDSIPGNVKLVQVSPLVRPLTNTFNGQPAVLPNVFEPINSGPMPGTPTVGFVFDFGSTLPRGRYRFELRSGPDGIRDLTGQPLDGEFNGRFPSGNGIPGGDFQTSMTTNGFFSYLPRFALGRLPRSLRS